MSRYFSRKQLRLVSICGFIAIMISSAGIAVIPSLGIPPLSIVYPGKIKIVSRTYSYKPGQRGVTRNFFYTDKTGRVKHISTIVVLLISVLFYSVVLAVLISSFLFIKSLRCKTNSDEENM